MSAQTSKYAFDLGDAEELAKKALVLCHAVRESHAGNIPKLVEKANDLGSYRTLKRVEERIEEVEGFIKFKRERAKDVRGGHIVPHVIAVGVSVEDALKNLCTAIDAGEATDFEKQDDPGEFEWYYRFRAGGTSCKAAGVHLPGGVAVTWWK